MKAWATASVASRWSGRSSRALHRAGCLGTVAAEVMAPKPEDNPTRAVSEHFTQTRWSLVLRAGELASTDATGALDRLCQTYWPPIFGFLRRKGYNLHDAQDLTQGFFAAFLRRNSLAAADPSKGRFRTYLLSSLTYYLADERDKARAQKRGGGEVIASLDAEEAENVLNAVASPDATPEIAFDQQWANTLLGQALEALQAEFEAARKLPQFAVLRRFLTEEACAGGYDDVALELGLKPGTVAVTVHRMRARYRELVRAEVAQTVADPADVDRELRALFLGA